MNKSFLSGFVKPLLVFLVCLFPLATYAAPDANSGVICGKIKDALLNEPLIGVAVLVEGTNIGAVTDIDGNYRIEGLDPGTYTITVSYVAYETVKVEDVPVEAAKEAVADVALKEINIELAGVEVVARKNLESANTLLLERKKSTVSVENMGAKEMSVKGISNVAEGVKKITGISMVGNGQLFVRGLGDRYSLTTMNGLVVASPNPDHKLIPLDLFPSSVVKNITVSKVYESTSFADYGGAHIDIATKENIGKDFLNLSYSIGGKLGSTFNDFYASDKSGGWKANNLSSQVKAMDASQFKQYVKGTDPFNSTFDISKKTALPAMDLGLNFGKVFSVGQGDLSVLGSMQIGTDYSSSDNEYVNTLASDGEKISEFNYSSYSQDTKASALANVSYQINNNHRIGYTFFYTRMLEDNMKNRIGYDAEGTDLQGINSMFHDYSLMNHQLIGGHKINSKWSIDWRGGYGVTSSDEPDRRQVLYVRQPDGSLTLYRVSQQETSRFFGELDEKALTGDLKLTYSLSDKNKIRLGSSYLNKDRDYYSTRFFYDLSSFRDKIENPLTPSDFINAANIENGVLTINKSDMSKYSYFAGSEVMAGFAELDFYPTDLLLLNVGLRYENAQQWVRYWSDSGKEQYTELNSNDFLPALNIKYTIDDKQAVRLGASRTMLRPQFIEMAPFLYRESYGTKAVRGNDELVNSYNYNLDLRYEYLGAKGDLYALTAYYKYLDSPIETVQELSGGAPINSFMNVDKGRAYGLEAEWRKQLTPQVNMGANLSWMYTHVTLPEGGVYTDKKRALQGASPILLNADVSYSPSIGEDRKLNLVLLYNLQGQRIESVGINGLGNVIEKACHTLDFNATLDLDKRWAFKLQAKNLLGADTVLEQEIENSDSNVLTERHQRQTSVKLGVSYKF